MEKSKNTKMSEQAGLPHKQKGDKRPHEHFQEKMTKSLTKGDCYGKAD